MKNPRRALAVIVVAISALVLALSLTSIYGKLDVRSRTQAVARARALDLL